MKKIDKNKLKKQLVSGGIYIALAAAVVTVTLNGVNTIIGDTEDYEVPDVDLKLPEVDNDNNPFLSDINLNSNPFESNNYISSGDNGTVVSGKADGVNAELSDDEKSEVKDNQQNTIDGNMDSKNDTQDNVTEDNVDASGEPEGIEYPTEPEPTVYGVYAKPADGYIDREFSLDELLYSPTMGDYRTHNGVDITGDLGSAVKAVSAGTVEDVYYDDFYGYTVAINHGEGVIAYYMNLSEAIPAAIVKGASVKTGQTIGGIGKSAMIESADVSHLHFSVKRNGEFIDPGEFLRG